MQHDREEGDMTESQKDMALQTICNAIQERASGKEKPTAEDLKALAESIGGAIAAGLKKLNESD